MQNNLDKYGLVKVKNPNGKFLRNIILGLCMLFMAFGGFAFSSLLPKDNVEAAASKYTGFPGASSYGESAKNGGNWVHAKAYVAFLDKDGNYIKSSGSITSHDPTLYSTNPSSDFKDSNGKYSNFVIQVTQNEKDDNGNQLSYYTTLPTLSTNYFRLPLVGGTGVFGIGSNTYTIKIVSEKVGYQYVGYSYPDQQDLDYTSIKYSQSVGDATEATNIGGDNGGPKYIFFFKQYDFMNASSKNYYYDLNSAVSGASSGNTIYQLRNHTTTYETTINKNITLMPYDSTVSFRCDYLGGVYVKSGTFTVKNNGSYILRLGGINTYTSGTAGNKASTDYGDRVNFLLNGGSMYIDCTVEGFYSSDRSLVTSSSISSSLTIGSNALIQYNKIDSGSGYALFNVYNFYINSGAVINYNWGLLFSEKEGGVGASTITGGTFSGNVGDSITGLIEIETKRTLNISGGVFTDNTQSDCFYNEGILNISGGTFSGYKGGSGDSFIKNRCILTISGGTFTDNESTAAGSVISNRSGCEVTISGGKFANNKTSYYGGVIYNSNGTVNISAGEFSGNTAESGGVIYNSDSGTVSISGGIFSNNTATEYGGVIHSVGTNVNSVNISGGTFINNVAKKGGVICNAGNDADNAGKTVVKITNGTFTANGKARGESQDVYGAVVYSDMDDSYVEISGGTFTSNCATKGGVAYCKRLIISGGTFGNAENDGDANMAFSDGGVVYNIGSCRIVTASFYYNYAINGGVVYNNGVVALEIYKGAVFSNNGDTSEKGGVIYSEAESSTALYGGNFEGNTSVEGGVIYNLGTLLVGGDAGSVDTENGTYTGNTASKGGVIYNAGTISLTDGIFKNNKASSSSSDALGGVIYNTGTITWEDSQYTSGKVFSGNDAKYGGVIYSLKGFTINDGTFSNNTVTSGGGVIYYNGEEELTINGGVFEGNTAGESGSGGVLSVYGGTITFNGGEFKNNSASSGGVLDAGNGSGTLSIIINDGLFTGNSATLGQYFGSGGVINFARLGNNDTLTISGGKFEGNSAKISGGAIYFNADKIVINSDSHASSEDKRATEFVNNTAGSGGAIYCNDGSLEITAGTFTGNKATYNGGAIYCAKDAIISGGKFEGNSAKNGGVIYGNGNFTISGGEFVNNIADEEGGVVNATKTQYATANPTLTISGGSFENNGTDIYHDMTSFDLSGNITKLSMKFGTGKYVNFTSKPATGNSYTIDLVDYTGYSLNGDTPLVDCTYDGATETDVSNLISLISIANQNYVIIQGVSSPTKLYMDELNKFVAKVYLKKSENLARYFTTLSDAVAYANSDLSSTRSNKAIINLLQDVVIDKTEYQNGFRLSDAEKYIVLTSATDVTITLKNGAYFVADGTLHVGAYLALQGNLTIDGQDADGNINEINTLFSPNGTDGFDSLALTLGYRLTIKNLKSSLALIDSEGTSRLTVDGPTFTSIEATGLIYSAKSLFLGAITVDNCTFKLSTEEVFSDVTGSVIFNAGTMTYDISESVGIAQFTQNKVDRDIITNNGTCTLYSDANYEGTISNYGTMTIAGGTFSGNSKKDIVHGGTALNLNGNFEAKITVASGKDINVTSKLSSAKFTVTTEDITKYGIDTTAIVNFTYTDVTANEVATQKACFVSANTDYSFVQGKANTTKLYLEKNITITFLVDDTVAGKVSLTTLTVPYGSIVSISDNILTINNQTVTAIATTASSTTRYLFNNWTVLDSELANPTALTADTTITANFTTQYKVTASVNTGDTTAKIAGDNGWTASGSGAYKWVDEGATIGTLPTATRTGYTFEGFYTMGTGGSQVPTSTVVSAAMTIYAHWTANSVKVTYDTNGGLFNYAYLETKTVNGITFTYDEINNILTINGTNTGTNDISISALNLGTRFFAINDKFDAKLEIISGTFPMSTSSAKNPALYFWAMGSRVNGINWESKSMAGLSADKLNSILTINNAYSSDATQGFFLQLKTYQRNYTFDNVQVKVTLTKSGVSSQETYMKFNSKYSTTMTTPVKDGYTFAGWYSDSALTHRVNRTDTMNSTSDVTLYAKWTAKTYTVTADANNGSISATTGWTVASGNKTATKSVTFNSAYGTLPTPTKSGYDFAGWYTDKTAGTKIETTTLYTTAGNSTIYAHWTPKSVKVTVQNLSKTSNEGTVMGTSTGTCTKDYKVGDTITLTNTPSGKYVFKKWVKGTDWSGTTVNATNDAYTYTITEADGEAGSITFSACYTLKVYLHAVFNGTVDDETGGQISFSNKTTYSKYAETDVAYNGPNEKFNIYAKVNDGYAFGGWFTTSACTGTPASTSLDYAYPKGSDGTINLYAKFTSNAYAITYKDQGGSAYTGYNINSLPSTHIYGTVTTLVDGVKAGYTFGGWYLTSDCTGEKVTSLGATDYVQDITLYAKWTIKNIKVTYDTNGGLFNYVSGNLHTTEENTLGGVTITYDKQTDILTLDGTQTASIHGFGSMRYGIGFFKQGDIYKFDIEIVSGSFTGNPYIALESRDSSGNYPNGNRNFGWYRLGTKTTGDLIVSADAEQVGSQMYLWSWKDSNTDVSFNKLQIKIKVYSPDKSSQTFEMKYGDKYSKWTTIPFKQGYTFNGWKLNNEFITDDTMISIDSDHTLVADWTANNYTITYNSNGGKYVATTNYKTADTITIPSTTRTGYTFAGWEVTTADGNWTLDDVFTAGKTLTGMYGNVALTAKWTANTDTAYKVEHYQMNLDGTNYTLKDTDNLTGTTGATTVAKAKTYTGFTAGTVTQTTIKADGTTVVRINYTRKTHTLTLTIGTGILTFTSTLTNANGLVSNSEQTYIVRYGASVPYQATEKSGYQTVVYKNGSTTVSSPLSMPDNDITITATASLIPYSISYNLDGGSVTGNPISYTVETATFTLNKPTKEGYTFAGWTGTGLTEATATVTITKGSTDNRSYTATWTVDSYKLTVTKVSGPTAEIKYTNANGIETTYNFKETETTKELTVKYGTTITITPSGNFANIATSNYKITGVTINGTKTEMSKAGSATATMPAKDITAVINIDTLYGFKVTTTANGTTTAKVGETSLTIGTQYYLASGLTVSVTATPNAGYIPAIDGDAGTVGTAKTSSFTTNTTAKVVAVTYSLSSYTVKVEVNPAGYGSVSTTEFKNVSYGSKITVSGNKITINETDSTATASANTAQYTYKFDSWSVNGDTVTGDMTITANFTKSVITYSITYDYDGGSLPSGETNQTSYQTSNAIQTLTLTNPTKTGCTFQKWTVSGDNASAKVEGTTLTIPANSYGNITLTAVWTANQQGLTVEAHVNTVSNPTEYNYDIGKVGGTVQIGSDAADSRVNKEGISYGTTVTIKANANSHYEFVGWFEKKTGDVVSETAISTDKEYTFTLQGDVIYVAKFKVITKTVTVNIPSDCRIRLATDDSTSDYSSVSDSQTQETFTFKEGATPQFEITPSKGYRVYQIMVDSIVVLTNDEIMDDGVKTYKFNDGLTDDHTLTITVVKRAYTVFYNVEDGTPTIASETRYNGEVFNITSQTVTKTGYKFEGWNDGTTTYKSGANYTMPNNNVTFTAVWTVIQSTLIVNPNGGSWNGTTLISTLTQNYGDKKIINNPTRNGYEFAGWELTGSGSYDSTTRTFTFGAGSATLMAKWTAETYTIAFNSNGGTQVVSQNYTVETDLTLISNIPSLKNHIFVGWRLARNVNNWQARIYNRSEHIGKGMYGDITLVAEWKFDGFDITYNIPKPEGMSEDETLYVNVLMREQSYWNQATNGEEKILNGIVGEFDVFPETEYSLGIPYKFKAVLEQYNVEKNTWSRVGEYIGAKPDDAGDSGLTFNINLDPYVTKVRVTLYRYSDNECTNDMLDDNHPVRLTPSDITNSVLKRLYLTAKISDSITVTYLTGYEFTLPKIFNTSFPFKGWADEDGNIIESIPANQAEDLVLTATFGEAKYSLYYDLDGGQWNKKASIRLYTGPAGSAVSILSLLKDNKLPYQKEGYNLVRYVLRNGTKGIFSPESSVVEGEVATYLDLATIQSMLENNTDYYFILGEGDGYIYGEWTPKEFNIILDGNGDLAGTILTVKYNTSIQLPEDVQLGWKFTGWWTTEDESGEQVSNPFYFDKLDDIVLYSHWVEKTYTITFDPNDGKVDPKNMEVKYDQIVDLPEPTRNGYEFSGWQYVKNADYDKWDGSEVTKPEGTGSKDDPYQIASGANLAWISQQLQNNASVYNNFENMYFIQTKHIDMDENTFTPIGTSYPTAFLGNYDGCKYVIKNLWIEQIFTDTVTNYLPPYLGLFGYLGQFNKQAKVENVIIDACSIYLTTNMTNDNKQVYIGGIAGRVGKAIINNITINNLVVDAKDQGNVTNQNIGAIAGYIDKTNNVTISNTIASAYFSCGTSSVTSYYYGGKNAPQGSFNEYSIEIDGAGTTTSSGYLEIDINDYETRDIDLSFVYDFDMDITLTAQWSEISYRIIYDVDGGEAVNDVVYTILDTITIETTTKSGCKLDYWIVSEGNGDWVAGDIVYANQEITDAFGDVTLRAHWSIVSIIVTLDSNGGTISTLSGWNITSDGLATKEISINSTYGTLPIATRQGYDFLGWYTAETNGEQITETSKVEITSNQTLYAHWNAKSKIQINVTVESNCDSTMMLIIKVYNVKTKETYTFSVNESTTITLYGLDPSLYMISFVNPSQHTAKVDDMTSKIGVLTEGTLIWDVTVSKTSTGGFGGRDTIV